MLRKKRGGDERLSYENLKAWFKTRGLKHGHSFGKCNRRHRYQYLNLFFCRTKLIL